MEALAASIDSLSGAEECAGRSVSAPPASLRLECGESNS